MHNSRGAHLEAQAGASRGSSMKDCLQQTAGTGVNPYGLSQRELEVLELVVQGLPDKEIALRLGVRPDTASKHVNAIRTKMGVHSRTEAAIRAVREGVVDGSG